MMLKSDIREHPLLYRDSLRLSIITPYLTQLKGVNTLMVREFFAFYTSSSGLKSDFHLCDNNYKVLKMNPVFKWLEYA